MSFRGRSFRPRAFPRPSRSGRGGAPVTRGNFRFQGPESYVGRPTSSSRDDYPGSERTSFGDRDDRFQTAPLSNEEFGARSHAREYADNSGPYSKGSSSYYGQRTSTIDYGHRGMKTASSPDDDHGTTTPWSSDAFPEHRHYSTERHRAADKPKAAPQGIEVDHPSKVVAVEKAMEMAQRTREMISKLGGFKQASQQSESLSSFTGSSVQPSAGFSHPETQSAETNTATAKAAAAESSAINKIRQNTSLVKYAFNLPVETKQANISGSSLPSHDVKSSWTDTEHKYGSTFEIPVPDHSRGTANYAATNVASASYEDNTAAYSQQSAWNVAPKVTPEPEKTDSCDPTIANILKSIGFNFELSNMMQDKARKGSPSAESSSHANRVPLLYEEKANRYRAEQMRQYKQDNEEPLHSHGTVDSSADKSSPRTLLHNYDDKPFAEDMFKESPPVDLKLKFKASEANAGQKSGTLYEDFSDSDDDFTATAKMDASVENRSKPVLASQSMPSAAGFGNEGMPQPVTTNKTADDLDWELSTEQFIRKLQQPRPPQRTVTVVPKSETTGRSVALQGERADDDMSEIQGENFKLAKSFVPLEELKTIRKTIIVSESPVKVDSGKGKSDSASSAKNVKNSSSNPEKTPRSPKSAEKASIDNGRKKKRGSEPDENDTPTSGSKVRKLDTSSLGSKERQKKIDALLRELENLKRQQNILMRRKKREKDAHKDPFLMENNKLQEEICSQIDKLRRASLQAVENSESETSDQSRSKTETETDERQQLRSVGKASRSISPESRDNRNYRSKSAVRNTDSASDRQPRVRRIDVHYEYFDGGNHFCRCCNCFSVNIFEHCQHLISSAHQLNVDPFDKPWLKLAAKAPTKPAGSKGKVTSARIRGVEFLMSTQAFYCSLCDVFLGSCTCAEAHCKSDEHNEKYAKYLDDNPYYERRLELEKSSSSAITGKALPASMQVQKSTSYSGGKDQSLVAALEKAKTRVQEMVKRRNQELENIDSEPLYPTFKKSRVVPKSSPGVLTENVTSRRLEDDNLGTDADNKKKSDSDSAANSEGASSEGVSSITESQKNETAKTKKSLPFIGKLPFLKAARTAKQAGGEQNAADDKSKIEIKVNVSPAVSTPGQSEPALSSAEAVKTSVQEQAVPKWLMSMPRSVVESSSVGEQNSLDAFLRIGDPESGQCQAVPVLNVGPQTRSEFILENPPNETEKAEASNTLSQSGKDVESANSSANVASAMHCGTGVADVPDPSVDVQVAKADEVTGDDQLSSSVPTSIPSNENHTDDMSLSVTSTSVVQMKDTQILSVSERRDANAAATVAATNTICNTDSVPAVKDHDSTSAMSLEDDNTEDYEAQNNAGSEQVDRLPRDENMAQILPQISAEWMVQADAVSDEDDGEAAMMSDFEILDECYAAD